MRGHRSPKAFSLVELIVVVAIIAILLAIAMPSMRYSQLDSQRTQCVANVRSLGTAVLLYATEHVGAWPTKTVVTSGGLVRFADSYGLRRDHPYSGAAERPAGGLGLLVTTGALADHDLGTTLHCPSLDNLAGPIPGHCMDVAHPNGFGGSGYHDYPDYRIIAGYSYRGTSWEWVHGKAPTLQGVDGNFAIVSDIHDQRFRGYTSRYNAHGGYSAAFADGGAQWLADPDYSVDALILVAVRRTGDGRGDLGTGAGTLDEAIYDRMAEMRN